MTIYTTSNNARSSDSGNSRFIRVAVAITSFNRRETTLSCLSNLFSQERPDVKISVYLLDDASSDGTAQAVAERFPQVQVLSGTGSRYWSGGTFDAMKAALSGEFDFLMLLNDDAVLRPDALQRMLEAYRVAVRKSNLNMHVIVGAFADPDTKELTYSGFRRPFRLLPARITKVAPAPKHLVSCDTMNGNCVLVPAEVVRRIGIVDDLFCHQLGDIDYGYRAVKAGICIWIAPGFIGSCSVGERSKPWVKPGLTIAQRWRLINQPKGLPLKPWLRFTWRHGGLVGVMALAYSYFKALVGR